MVGRRKTSLCRPLGIHPRPSARIPLACRVCPYHSLARVSINYFPTLRWPRAFSRPVVVCPSKNQRPYALASSMYMSKFTTVVQRTREVYLGGIRANLQLCNTCKRSEAITRRREAPLIAATRLRLAIATSSLSSYTTFPMPLAAIPSSVGDDDIQERRHQPRKPRTGRREGNAITGEGGSQYGRSSCRSAVSMRRSF